MKPPVFLTGATGFLGMEVMARLLERGDREVLALVRAPDQVAAQERLDGVLAKLWRDPSPYVERVRAVFDVYDNMNLVLAAELLRDLSSLLLVAYTVEAARLDPSNLGVQINPDVLKIIAEVLGGGTIQPAATRITL